MAGASDYIIKKWDIIKEQLIALSALNALPKGNDQFVKLLGEEVQIKNLSTQHFTSFCYFVLGVISYEEREKLIQWPLINIQTNAKFRKGVSALVNFLQEKYPWANIKKLPESHFVDPSGNLWKVVEFLGKLTNLAIHLSLRQADLLMNHSGEGVTLKEMEIMREVVGRSIQLEEDAIGRNVLHYEDFEEVIENTCNKCIALKQVNDSLQDEFRNLTREAALTKEMIVDEKTTGVEELKKVKTAKLSELEKISEELSKTDSLSEELLAKMKSLKCPVSLSAKDFGCGSSLSDIVDATSRTCRNLNNLFQYLSSRNSTKEDNERFYQQLKTLKNCLEREQQSYSSFLSKVSSVTLSV